MKISVAKIFHNFVTLLSTTVLAVQPVLAQYITSAPTGPQVLTSASGIDMVMINGVDTNGVSHNIYTDFNVGASSVVFNNANTEFVMTDLAGWVQGNGNLIGGTAQIIINEVIGGSIRFGNNSGPNRGAITVWSNSSGHYLPLESYSGYAGLPLNLFYPHLGVPK